MAGHHGGENRLPDSQTVIVADDEPHFRIRALLQGHAALPAGLDRDGESSPETSLLVERLRQLTPQQARVLALMAEGLLNKQIAHELGVSLATVKAHVSAILRKLEVACRADAVSVRMKAVGVR